MRRRLALAALALLPGCVTVTRHGFDAPPPQAAPASPASTDAPAASASSSAPASTSVAAEPEPEAPAPPPPPTLAGHVVADGAVVPMPALVLACVPAKGGATNPASAQEKLAQVAARQGVSLGGVRVVRLLRDPARSLERPPPRACREMLDGARPTAPLFVEREPETGWLLVEPRSSDVAKEAARLLDESREKRMNGILPPRLVLDEQGRVVALALPVAAE